MVKPRANLLYFGMNLMKDKFKGQFCYGQKGCMENWCLRISEYVFEFGNLAFIKSVKR